MRRMRVGITLSMLLVAVGCSDGYSPKAWSVLPGHYSAGRLDSNGRVGGLTITNLATNASIDWLAKGAMIDITLSADSTTTGTMFLPGADTVGGVPRDVTADLTGRWRVDRELFVTFTQPADTFLRDMTFFDMGDELTSDATLNGSRVSVDLRRAGATR